MFPREQRGLDPWRLKGSSWETPGSKRKGVLHLAPWGSQGRTAGWGFLDTPAPGPTSGQDQGPPLPSRTFPRHVSPFLPPPCFVLRARAVTREGAGLGKQEGARGGRGAGRESRRQHVTRP